MSSKRWSKKMNDTINFKSRINKSVNISKRNRSDDSDSDYETCAKNLLPLINQVEERDKNMQTCNRCQCRFFKKKPRLDNPDIYTKEQISLRDLTKSPIAYSTNIDEVLSKTKEIGEIIKKNKTVKFDEKYKKVDKNKPFTYKPFTSNTYTVKLKEPIINPKKVQGTPDYLAPELLLKEKHDERIDWWALGVCVFEFLFGIPPFNDDSPSKIFHNILYRGIKWPDEDSKNYHHVCVNFIKNLLKTSVNQRYVYKDIIKDKFFENFDWNHILDMTAPFTPFPDDPTDTTYFNPRNKEQNINTDEPSVN
ncbi:hypothetical protein A3Q56_07172 [Intoshia linei]|uniref:Serine/threonine-protein kinase greatwall n=1 Tax=Intoshia linei TaxID=1819745 RepID=A0A177AUQ1_9BILA|nr:hypothetical protein A3Q56_07172 [Intoshia linei]